MDILWSPYGKRLQIITANEEITNKDIEEVMKKVLLAVFPKEEVNTKMDILNKLFYKWYNQRYIHNVAVSNKELDEFKWIDKALHIQEKFEIWNKVFIYVSSITTIIESIVIVKKWLNIDDEKKLLRNQ